MTYADVQSIMVLGDSIARGVVLHPEKKRYVFSGEGFIKKLREKLHPKVFDYSKYGSTTGYGRQVLAEKLTMDAPDLVFIEYGSNDSDYKWDEVAANPHATHLPNLSLAEYTANLESMIREVQGRGGIPILSNLHPLCGLRYFNWFTQNDPARQKATLVWLKSVENIYWWQEMYSYALERTARRQGAKVIDIRSAFLRQEDYRTLLCEDGIHPTEAGQALIEQTIMEAVRRAASELLRPPV